MPQAPFIEHISTFDCRDLSEHGAISIWRHWVFMSVVKDGAASPACRSPREDGIIVVDIEDPLAPEMEMFIKTSCASGTHSLLPAGDRLYLYGGGHNNVRETCNSDSPLPSGDIEVIRFSPGDPPSARVVARPKFEVATGCHDLTVLPEHHLAACSDPPYNLNLLDIRDPVNPTELASVDERSLIGVAPMFTWDGEGLIDYEGESQGTCTPTERSDSGSLAIYSTRSDPSLQRIGSFQLERFASSPCYFTSGNVIPMRDGRDVVVSSWLRGGMSLIDFTDASAPMEIAHWMLEGTQVDAAYWYNGRIYLVETGTANDSEIGPSTSPPGVRIQHGGPDAVVSPAPSGIRVLDVAGYGEEASRLFRNGYNNRSQIADFVRDDPPRRTKGKCRRGKRGPGRRCRPKATTAAP